VQEIRPVRLTAATFKDYGCVLSETLQDPMSDNNDFKYWGKLNKLETGPVVSSGLLQGYQREMVKSMERHLNTPEIMVALKGKSVICVAKPSKNSNEIEGVRAFLLEQGDAFALHKGTWHYVPFATTDVGCKFLILFADQTEERDLKVKDLPEKVKITI
jgi:ureidoglycolate hydrolase